MSLESVISKAGEWTGGIAGILKALLRSGKPFAAGQPRDRRLVIMANGPSLRKLLDSDLERLASETTMAVNFAANAPEYFSLRPEFYILADPHFFNGGGKDPTVPRLWENLRKTGWKMTMFLPIQHRGQIRDFFSREGTLPENVEIKWFNLTPADGAKPVRHLLYRRGLATPRPRNVLIAALMCALREGFRDIVIVGADHTWLQTLWIDDHNRVVSVQPHFYKDNEKELDRVAKEYEGYHLHDILGSMTVAFRSYHLIADYAASIGARISNATPGSYIDAFPRMEKF